MRMPPILAISHFDRTYETSYTPTFHGFFPWFSVDEFRPSPENRIKGHRQWHAAVMPQSQRAERVKPEIIRHSQSRGKPLALMLLQPLIGSSPPQLLRMFSNGKLDLVGTLMTNDRRTYRTRPDRSAQHRACISRLLSIGHHANTSLNRLPALRATWQPQRLTPEFLTTGTKHEHPVAFRTTTVCQTAQIHTIEGRG